MRSELKWSTWSHTPSPTKVLFDVSVLLARLLPVLAVFCPFLSPFPPPHGSACRRAITPIVGGTIRFPADQCLRVGVPGPLLSPLAHRPLPVAAPAPPNIGSVRFDLNRCRHYPLFFAIRCIELNEMEAGQLAVLH